MPFNFHVALADQLNLLANKLVCDFLFNFYQYDMSSLDASIQNNIFANQRMCRLAYTKQTSTNNKLHIYNLN